MKSPLHPVDDVACRDAFEKWFFLTTKPRRNGSSYELSSAAISWAAWEIAWQTRTSPPADAPAPDVTIVAEAIRNCCKDGHIDFFKAAKAVISAMPRAEVKAPAQGVDDAEAVKAAHKAFDNAYCAGETTYKAVDEALINYRAYLAPAQPVNTMLPVISQQIIADAMADYYGEGAYKPAAIAPLHTFIAMALTASHQPRADNSRDLLSLIADCRDALNAGRPYMEGSTFNMVYARRQVKETAERCQNALDAHQPSAGMGDATKRESGAITDEDRREIVDLMVNRASAMGDISLQRNMGSALSAILSDPRFEIRRRG
jgi:hypothetical protein